MTPITIDTDALTVLIKFLQGCITPVAMISGVGLLLLTVTNRLGRTIDRTRYIIADLDKGECIRAEEKKSEIKIFIKRSEILRNSIAWIMISMISSCLIIPLIFLMSFAKINLNMFCYGFFLISIASMLIAFVYFFRDILQSLHAIKLEANEYT